MENLSLRTCSVLGACNPGLYSSKKEAVCIRMMTATFFKHNNLLLLFCNPSFPFTVFQVIGDDLCLAHERQIYLCVLLFVFHHVLKVLAFHTCSSELLC